MYLRDIDDIFTACAYAQARWNIDLLDSIFWEVVSEAEDPEEATAEEKKDISVVGDVSLSCGSSGISTARDGKEWHGDAQPKLSSLFQIKGSSTASSVTHKLISADDPIPYKTGRFSRSCFSYAFQVTPGEKILRLHFNPVPYKGFKRLRDLFDVEAGAFTLLSNFSASLAANALGLNSFVKEFCVNIEENEQLNIVFSPSSSESLNTYAFINGIEVISVPPDLSYFHKGNIGVQMVGKSLVYVDNGTALKIIRRVNIKHDSVLSGGSINDMFGMRETISKKKASKINNITWKVSVDVGFRYLVRLHFSELGYKMAKIGGVIFTVSINEMIANIDENSIPWYRDYMVMMKGHKEEGKHDLLICLKSNDEFMDGHGPLKGFEIIKLSNPDDSLASPNPLPSSPDSSYQNLHHILGHRNMIATAAITLLVAVNTIVYTSRQFLEASGTEEENKPSARAKQLCRRFSLDELQLATEDFSESHLIGRGGFGRVYKGLIDNGRQTVAIKRQKLESHQGPHEFLTEIETLTELRHVNLVSLIGYCNELGERILVYEYLPHGTLVDHLYKLSRKGKDHLSLTWKQRLTICIGAGRGLNYLHTGHSLIHRDVKASNILLDENFVAKVSDFGLAKYLSKRKLQSHVSTKVKGTFGYFDPNYFNTGKLTVKSDTYAFGVMLLEVLSGRPAVDQRAAADERVLTKWAREKISNGNADQIIASNLRGEITEDSLKVFVGVAESCLHDEPRKRLTMAQVVLQLEFALKQQESSKSLVPNEIASDVNDSHPSDEKTNLSVASTDITPSLKEQNTNREVVNAEPSSGRREGEKATTDKSLHPSDGKTKLSVSTGKPTMTSTDVQNHTTSLKEETNSKVVDAEPTSGRKDGRKATKNKPSRFRLWDAFFNRVKPSEVAEKDKQTADMLLIAVDAIPVDVLNDVTENFGLNCLIGEGSHGRVYRGVTKTGQATAIKNLYSPSKENKFNFSYQQDQDFLAQVWP
ncbi:PREDICTED: putative receptor-like protein kinase At5g39000 [Erythranthe guttata]|uniref:putative receptor-like protein kinase At5g39000 n=1 Tax=Erythranthe guttata TaxID=4155 RepID=UPI00064D8ED2|nr:PREDICTED: putative receptor-like protein kinase At5g39000 [Erythranthe guttata]|eukprot:XP_012855541.1 PREDICTED: putative receptor-like protein kinase At5g39000 [Erythranthe guttata]